MNGADPCRGCGQAYCRYCHPRPRTEGPVLREAAPLPVCAVCGVQTMCNTVCVANDAPIYLCPELCLPALRDDVREWMELQRQHHATLQLQDACAPTPDPCPPTPELP